jgi:isopentenyl phosphate kinase
MLVFLKLGGSLITDKTRPYTPRLEMLESLSHEIAASMKENPDLQVILGHGSGSFGHQAANQYDTRRGVSASEGWRGFAEVWYQASALNRLVVDTLRKAGLPVVTLSPFSAVMSRDGHVVTWDLSFLNAALANGLFPVIHGDVVFDVDRGGTILSTEDLFTHLAPILKPKRILLSGQESGVWADFPARTHLLQELTSQTMETQAPGLGLGTGADVTGGMESKVTEMLALMKIVPGLEVIIFSGKEPGNIRAALNGENPGTRLHS